MRKSICLLSLGIVITIASCSDPKAPNENNFKIAIQNYLNTQRFCFVIPLEHPLPTDISSDPTLNENELDALAAAGVISQTHITVPIENFNGTLESKPGVHIELTKKGQKYAALSHVYLDQTALCIGKLAIKRITQFTIPSDSHGNVISHVAFIWKLEDVPDWARDKRIQLWFNRAGSNLRLGEAMDIEQKDYATLVLTDSGWIDSRLLDRRIFENN